MSLEPAHHHRALGQGLDDVFDSRDLVRAERATGATDLEERDQLAVEQQRDHGDAGCAAEVGQDDESNLKTRLLQDIRRVFARRDNPDILRTRDLLEAARPQR